MAKMKNKLVIASTTSSQNSGLFGILMPAYEKFSKYQSIVEVIALGQGRPSDWLKKDKLMPFLFMIHSAKKNFWLKVMESIVGR
jgi:ABC-type tungstate transport system permease subunit